MPAKLDLTGGRFGRWTVLEETDQRANNAVLWLARCDCGTERLVRGTQMCSGQSQSCGCTTADAQVTHGMSKAPLYVVWRGMRDRTENPNHRGYARYGGRGITVCDRWKSFRLFASDMASGYASGLELDRIDNEGNYEPLNCRWVNHADQQRNKSTNHLITWRGETMIVTDWAARLGIKPNTLIYRLRRGWELDRAMTTGAVLLEIANS